MEEKFNNNTMNEETGMVNAGYNDTSVAPTTQTDETVKTVAKVAVIAGGIFLAKKGYNKLKAIHADYKRGKQIRLDEEQVANATVVQQPAPQPAPAPQPVVVEAQAVEVNAETVNTK